jgi:pyruvate kinase
MDTGIERTKVVATLGPASSDAAMLAAMITAGVDVVRLNFSHGERADHVARIELVRKVAAECDKAVAILADLQGPKIRVGRVSDPGITLVTGEACVLVAGTEQAPPPEIPVVYESLATDVRPGDRVLLDDGAIELQVRAADPPLVRCEVRRGGVVRSRKGVNLPGVAVSASSLTEKDRADLATAVEHGADYVALSFVRRGEDVLACRQAVADLGGDLPVVAKLERPEAIEHLDDILDATDAVMVARGDLGVELAVEKVPPLQKGIIARANSAGVPVITATQMLESMVSNARPTRAEASDVANAIFDGTDAVMLSQETAVGAFPVEVVATMVRIAREAESAPHLLPPPAPPGGALDVAATVCRAAVQAATDLNARAVVAFTDSGATARYVSRFRPRMTIVGLTPHERTRRRMALYWGVETPAVLDQVVDLDTLVDQGDRRMVAAGVVRTGDLVVIAAGTPGGRGATNRVIVHEVGHPELASEMHRSELTAD